MLSHVSHVASVLVLYELSLVMFWELREVHRFAFLSACLHIISPAGIFLSAPYGESLFSLLQLGGLYCYASASLARSGSSRLIQPGRLVLSGLLLGLATLVRSNGILSGLLFAWDAARDSFGIIQSQQRRASLRRLACTMVAGSLVAAGAILPQFIAYMEYCAERGRDGSSRSWCDRLPPSIYTFVQSHYW